MHKGRSIRILRQNTIIDYRDEPNKRKRKADEVKVEEDVPEIPTVKRDKKARDKDKDKEPPANKG